MQNRRLPVRVLSRDRGNARTRNIFSDSTPTHWARVNCFPMTLAAGFRPGARGATGLPGIRSSPSTKSSAPAGRPLRSDLRSTANASSQRFPKS